MGYVSQWKDRQVPLFTYRSNGSLKSGMDHVINFVIAVLVIFMALLVLWPALVYMVAKVLLG